MKPMWEGRDFNFEFLDSRRIIMLHGLHPPPADGWREYLQHLRNHDVTNLGLLAFTNGGAPDPTQRHELNSVLQGRHFARAIVHCSVLVRGVVAAVSWFSSGVAAFAPNDWHAAAAHAGFHRAELARVGRTVSRMHARMNHGIPWLEAVLAAGDGTSAAEAAPARSQLDDHRDSLGAPKIRLSFGP